MGVVQKTSQVNDQKQSRSGGGRSEKWNHRDWRKKIKKKQKQKWKMPRTKVNTTSAGLQHSGAEKLEQKVTSAGLQNSGRKLQKRKWLSGENYDQAEFGRIGITKISKYPIQWGFCNSDMIECHIRIWKCLGLKKGLGNWSFVQKEPL